MAASFVGQELGSSTRTIVLTISPGTNQSLADCPAPPLLSQYWGPRTQIPGKILPPTGQPLSDCQ